MTNFPTSPRFHGRRKGRPLRKSMQTLLDNMLPALRFDAKQLISEQFGQTADLALEIGPKIKKDFDNKTLPLMISMIDTICEEKSLKINWKNFK